MDTAFLNRVGFTCGWIYGDLNFYPEQGRYPWIRRVSSFTFLQGGRDRINDGNEYIDVAGVRLSFTRQGFFRLDQHLRPRGMAGPAVRKRPHAHVRPRCSCSAGCDLRHAQLGRRDVLRRGRSVSGKVARHAPWAPLFQPNGRFTRGPRVHAHRLRSRDRPASASTRVNIVNTRTTYQFSQGARRPRHRAVRQPGERVLTDFLGSYELRPGTVVFAGYGSLYEQRAYQDDRLDRRPGRLPDHPPRPVLQGELPL